MNWRMGLLRLWIVATGIWFMIVVGWAWLVAYPYGLDPLYPAFDWARDTLRDLAGLLFMPPVAVLIVGVVLAWALRGFRAR